MTDEASLRRIASALERIADSLESKPVPEIQPLELSTIESMPPQLSISIMLDSGEIGFEDKMAAMMRHLSPYLTEMSN